MQNRQKQWQMRLLGFYGGAVDGIFGNASREGTRRLQSSLGLYPDGIFGPLTQERSRQKVSAIQQAIREHGSLSPVTDGLAGPETRKALLIFQHSRGLTADGIAGRRTLAALGLGPGILPPASDFWKEIRYFSREEFRCPCGRCGGFPVQPEEALVRLAERVRAHFGAPAHISSGVRCRAHNRELTGSVPNSRHLLGKAVDFCIPGCGSGALLDYVRVQPEVRYAYAIDSAYIHMDIR